MPKGVLLKWLVPAAVCVLAVFAVADGLRSRLPSSTTEPAPSSSAEEEVTPGRFPKREIQRIGNRWAALFATSQGCNIYHMGGQPICERMGCVRIDGVKIRNCRPVTSAFRKSFKGAIVLDIAFKRPGGAARFSKTQAAARFSNGEVVEFRGDGGTWSISKLGPGNTGRGYFE